MGIAPFWANFGRTHPLNSQFFRNALGDTSESINAGTSSSVPAFFRMPRDVSLSVQVDINCQERECIR
jgi:hypothetical protein